MRKHEHLSDPSAVQGLEKMFAKRANQQASSEELLY
jgi:hypothetical protein